MGFWDRLRRKKTEDSEEDEDEEQNRGFDYYRWSRRQHRATC